MKVINIINEEINKFYEGVADVAAERMFNISDPYAKMDVQAKGEIQKAADKPVAYVEDIFDGDLIQIYKNPSSLSNFDNEVRAISDFHGDLYVAQKNKKFNHGAMGNVLFPQLGKWSMGNTGVYLHADKYIFLHRIDDTNKFGLGDSSEDYAEQNLQQKRSVNNLLLLAKKRNPQYVFFNVYYAQVSSSDIPVGEYVAEIDVKDIVREEIENMQNTTGKKLYYHGRSKSRPYTGKYIFLTDSLGYASGYSDGKILYIYSLPFGEEKLFSIKNPTHLRMLEKYIDNYTIQQIFKSSGDNEEIDWAALSFISTDEFEQPEDLFEHMGFFGIRLKERTGIESIYIFDEKNLTPEGTVDITTPENQNKIRQFYKDFTKDKNFLEELMAVS